LVIDKDRKVVAWNRAMEKMTGIPAAEMLGKGDYAYTVPFYGERRPMMIDFALSPGEAIPERYAAAGEAEHRLSGELYVPTVYEGRGAYLLATAAALYDKEGNVMGAVESIRDITDRKQAEEQVERVLRETRVRYEVSQALAGTETEEDVLDVLGQQAGLYLEAQVTLLTFDRQGDETNVILRRDNLFESGLVSTVTVGTRFPAAHFPLIKLFAPDKPFISNDFFADERVDPAAQQLLRPIGAASLAVFPLTAGGEWMGYINAMAKPVGYFDEIKQQLYQTLAEQGAVALQTARLRDQIQSSMTRRGYQVQVSTEIAQEISAASELGALFQRVVTVVKERLGYYHTQLLRYDPGRDAVVLIAGYGETGAKMLATSHKMEMGRGIIGTAAASGEAVLRPNLADDPDWQPNPLLPETKGEIAVPIKLGDQILGVLDVQSSQANALGDDDRLLLEGLCGQIAIAMEQTRLREEMAERLAEINRLYRAMSHEGWQAFRQAGSLPEGFVYDQLGVTNVTNAQLNEELFSNVQMAVPGGEVLGSLMVEDDPLRPFSSDDQAFLQQISEQIALALESARLFEQNQTALAETESLYQLSAVLNTAATYDNILRVLRENTILGKNSQNISLNVFDRTWTPQEEPQWIEVLARWSILSTESVLNRYTIASFPSARTLLRSDTPTIVEDVDIDEKLDDNSRALYSKRFGAKSTIFIPLVVTGQWIGYINAIYQQQTTFPETEVRRLTSLAAQAATMINNLRQVMRIQQQAEREATLNAITQKIQSATTVEDVLQIAARELGHALGAPMTIAQLSMKNK
jgi:PAS domain S-box-containing protein